LTGEDAFRFSPRPNQADSIHWREWGEEAFAAAAREEKMVLLSISAVWCHWCHVMDETTYSDPEIIRTINDNFIPVRVDNDRRPEINRRYNQGGWPTTAFLEPHGNILAGSTYIPPENMRGVLNRFIELWRDKREDITSNVEEVLEEIVKDGKNEEPAGLHTGIREDVWRAAVHSQDLQHGGLGDAPKFPMFEVMELALDIYQDRNNPSALAWLILTADSMLTSETYDQVEGGLFRYSTTRDWSVPHFEKMLADNAQMARLLLRLWLLTGKPFYASRARHILDFVGATLGDGKGRFFGSQDADEAYYALDLAGRRGLQPPFVDTTVYVDGEAQMVEAYLEAGEMLDDPRYRKLGRAGLDLLAGLVSGESGLPHYLNGAVTFHRGLLEDQATVLLALLRGYQLSGEPALLKKALLLGELIRNNYWNETRGMLSDVDPRMAPANLSPQPAEIGLAALTAKGLILLAELAAEPGFAETATRVLEAYSGSYSLYSFHAAPYARAVDLLLSRPRVVTLGGVPGEEKYEVLKHIAFLSPLPRLLISPRGNNQETEGKASKDESPSAAAATVCEGTRCDLATGDIETLAEALLVNENVLKGGE
jgi:uncharacterized protein YyaL (SSP411 family)